MTSLLNGIIFMTVAAVLLSCSTSKKTAIAVSSDGLPPLQESVINIPVKVYALPFIQDVAAKTAVQFSSPSWPDFVSSGCDFRYKYRFIRSGFRIACLNNKATIMIAGHYQIAGSKSVCAFGKQVTPWIGGSCGFSPEPMRRVEISIGSSFAFQPDYSVKAMTTVEGIIPLDKCTVTLINTDITDLVMNNIRSSLNAFASSLDRTIASINLTSIIRKMGDFTGKKIPLGNYGYIKINPVSIKMAPVNYYRDTLLLTAGLTCYPAISSDLVNHVATTSLPPLTTGTPEDGFMINANAVYDYRFIDTLITTLVKNKPFMVRGRKINIGRITVRGLEHNMAEVRVDFTGSKSGTVYLRGTPVLDEKNQVISVPDLDYSVRSKDFVITLGSGFFNKKIVRTIRRKAVLKVRDIYHIHKADVDAALNRTVARNIFTTGYTHDVRLTALAVKEDNLLFQVSASGKVEVVVTGK